MVEKIKEVELKLLATNKELEEYKALAKYNEKRFKVYQNDHSSKCQCSTVINELQVTLRKKDDELNECKKTMSKNEQIIKQNQIRINECESMLTNQVVQMEIFRSKAEVIEEELELYDWTIDLSELFENGDNLDSAPFYTSSDLYCLSLSVDHNKDKNIMEIYLHRCRDNNKEEEKEGRIQTFEGFDYNIYVVCNGKIVCSDEGSFTNYPLFNIGRAYQRSRGFVCHEFHYDDIVTLVDKNFHIFCKASIF